MIARILIELPFVFTIPENETYNIYTFPYKEYQVRYGPPFKKSPKADSSSGSQSATINSKQAHYADILEIDFIKSEFDRRAESALDPEIEDITKVVNDLLTRIRYVISASQVRSLNFNKVSLRVEYLNDDETELEKQEGCVRARGTKNLRLNYNVLTTDIWDSVNSLEPFGELPSWRALLLDAEAVLPQIGSAIILTFTALEVFISKTLDSIAKHNNRDETLWKWINKRGYGKNPSIEERYDFLSKDLIGKSIKDEQTLWVAFKEIQKARNDFAHTGECILNGSQITEEKALGLIAKANEIIDFVKVHLPKEVHWPQFHYIVDFDLSIPLVDPPEK